ncbi:MAG: DMT family transporter [Anderseniella sp.]
MSHDCPKSENRDNLALAIAAIIIAVLALSAGDAAIKYIGASFPLWQTYILRSALAIVPLLAFIRWKQPGRSLVPRALGWVTTRSAMLAIMWACYYLALPHVKLAVAAASYYTTPLFIALLSAVLTGDKVGLFKWMAILLGFAGVLVMLRPDPDGLNWYVLLPLVSAILYALSMILTRTKCRDDSPLLLSLNLNMTFIVFGAVFGLAITQFDGSGSLMSTNALLFGGWVTLDQSAWLVMTMLAVAILIGSIGAALAYQNGPAPVVAVFDNAYLLFSVIWGILVFAEVPDIWSLAGMVMIVTAGTVVVTLR